MSEPTDPEIEALLAPLRRAEPTAAMRADNRAAAFSTAEANFAPPWWRRSIAVPVPVVLATAAGLLIAIGWTKLPPAPATTDATDPPAVIVSPVPPGRFEMLAQATADPNDPDPSFSESMRYLPGVGVVSRRVDYQPQER